MQIAKSWRHTQGNTVARILKFYKQMKQARCIFLFMAVQVTAKEANKN